mgnify:CR=1 FL=1
MVGRIAEEQRNRTVAAVAGAEEGACRGFRQRFEAAAERREQELRTSLARAGVDTRELPTDADLGDSILSFVDARRQRSRLAAGAMPLHNRGDRPRYSVDEGLT